MIEPLILDFGAIGARTTDEDQGIARSLSAAVGAGKALWTASDETSSIERLVWTGAGYGQAQSFRLDDYFSLPDGKHEVDVEGLALNGNRLWITGSHSLTRSNPYKDQDEPAKMRLAAFSKLSPRKRRRLLGCLTLSADGLWIVDPKNGRAPCLPFKKGDLRSILTDDPYIGPFLGLGDKENGLDIEGLAVSGKCVMLGLRGPVLRSQVAVVVELRVDIDAIRLRASRLAGDGPPYKLHFLPLGGVGIRDMQAIGDDLVLLTGPTMGFDAPFATRRWRGAMAGAEGGLVDPGRLEPGPAIALMGEGRPEALSWLDRPDGRRGWLVLHDSPTCTRYTANGTYRADFIPA